MTRFFAGYLDANIYNIDDIVSGEQISASRVNTRRYESYKCDFLTTSESEQSTARDIF